jgi:hypothetical protein
MPTLAIGDNPAILEPPQAVRDEIATLEAGLDADVRPRLLDTNLLVATWNVRAFGGMSDTWARGEKDSPKRNLADALAIATILSRFDVVAVQEARSNLRALRHVLKALGPEWGLILTDVNPTPATPAASSGPGTC